MLNEHDLKELYEQIERQNKEAAKSEWSQKDENPETTRTK